MTMRILVIDGHPRDFRAGFDFAHIDVGTSCD